MKRLAPAFTFLAFIALAACSTFKQATAPQPIPRRTEAQDGTQPAAAEPEVAQLINFIRVDIQNALDGATAAHDDIGVRCHQDGLDFLNIAIPPQMKVTGGVSGAQQLRLVKLAFIQNAPRWQKIKDECSPIYSVGGIFGRLLRRLGLDALL